MRFGEGIVAWRQIIVYSRSGEFLSFLQDVIGDLPYTIRLVRSLDEIKSTGGLGSVDAFVLEGAPGQEDDTVQITSTILAEKPVLPFCILYRNQFNLEKLKQFKTSLNVVNFLFPFDKEFFTDWLLQTILVEVETDQLKINHLLPVRLKNIGSEEKFNFDIYYYMPLNKKFIHFRRADSSLTAFEASRFEKHNVRDIFIKRGELPKFHNHLARRFKKAIGEKGFSEQRQREVLRDEAREIFKVIMSGNLQSDSQKQRALDSCKKIGMEILTTVPEKKDLFLKLNEFVKMTVSNYSHAANVSIYSSLFAMALGEKNYEAAALGGLLHDIGHASLTQIVDEFDTSGLTEEQLLELKMHPEFGVQLISKVNIHSMKEVQEILQNHHENWDGSGYPKGLKGEKIPKLARICAIADDFDHLTSTRFGRVTLSPDAAILKMIESNATVKKYDVNMLKELRSLFMSEEDAKAMDVALGDSETKSDVVAEPIEPPAQVESETVQEEVPDQEETPVQEEAPGQGKKKGRDDTKRRRRVKSGMKY